MTRKRIQKRQLKKDNDNDNDNKKDKVEEKPPHCVICLDETPPLFHPGCACNGSMAYFHENCLKDCITKTLHDNHCGVCKQPFAVRHDMDIIALSYMAPFLVFFLFLGVMVVLSAIPTVALHLLFGTGWWLAIVVGIYMTIQWILLGTFLIWNVDFITLDYHSAVEVLLFRLFVIYPSVVIYAFIDTSLDIFRHERARFLTTNQRYGIPYSSSSCLDDL